MREMRIIVPKNDNAGRSLNDLHLAVRYRLFEIFGGFTAGVEDGGSKRSISGEIVEELVVNYMIAAHENKDAQLIQLAMWIVIEAKQDSVYVKLYDQTAHFVTAPAKDKQKRGLAVV